MGLKEALTSGALTGVIAMLDKVIELIHATLISGGNMDEEFKQGLATVVLWEPLLRKGALSTETQYDDKVLDEIVQAAESILPVTLISEIRAIHVLGIEEDQEPASDPEPVSEPVPTEPG